MASLLRPVTMRAGRQLAERLLNADPATLADALRRTRSRAGTAPPADGGNGSTTGGGGGGEH
jgi:hypothetical protein